jgi:hypothetical protein
MQEADGALEHMVEQLLALSAAGVSEVLPAAAALLSQATTHPALRHSIDDADGFAKIVGLWEEPGRGIAGRPRGLLTFRNSEVVPCRSRAAGGDRNSIDLAAQVV